MKVAALDEAFRERTAALVARFGDQSPESAVADYHGEYLQDGHLSALAIGCPVPTMAGDVARSPEPADRNVPRVSWLTGECSV